MTSQPPVRERHYLVLPQLGLAYCRVPKAANSSVRYLLARRFGFKAPEAEPNLVPNKDRFWTGQPPGVAHCLTPADFALLLLEISRGGLNPGGGYRVNSPAKAQEKHPPCFQLSKHIFKTRNK